MCVLWKKFKSFVHLNCTLLVIHVSSLYILDISPLSEIRFTLISSHSVGCFLPCWWFPLTRRSFKVWWLAPTCVFNSAAVISNFCIFLIVTSCAGVKSWNYLPFSLSPIINGCLISLSCVVVLVFIHASIDLFVGSLTHSSSLHPAHLVQPPLGPSPPPWVSFTLLGWSAGCLSLMSLEAHV